MAGENKVSSITKGLISPGIGILTSWQGIVEICLRGAVLVLSLIVIIAGASCQSSVTAVDSNNVPNTETNAAAGWLIFVGVVGLFYEIAAILQRFLNIGIINDHILIFIIVDSIVHGVIAVSLFAGGVALASYVTTWKAFVNDSIVGPTIRRIVASSEAAAVFAFVLIFLLLGLSLFLLLGVLVFKWKPTMGKYTVSGGEA